MTTTDTIATPTPAVATRRLPRARSVIAAFLIGVIAAGGASAAGLYTYDQAHSGVIFPGVRVGSVDLSNLDRTAATAALTTALAGYGQGTVILTDGVIQESISYADLGRQADVATLVDEAFAVGRTGDIAERTVDEVRTAFRGVNLEPTVSLDPTAVANAVGMLATRDHRDPVDAAAVATATGFTTTAATAGRSIDQAATAAAIETALADPSAPAQVHVALTSVTLPPTISDAIATSARARAASIAQDLVVVAGSKTWTLAAATIRGWITFGFDAGQYGPIVSAADLTNALKPFAKSILKTAHDATFLIGKNGRIAGVTASTTGQSLDVPGTLAAIDGALAARAAGTASVGGDVTASVKITLPKLTTEVAKQSAPLMKAISSWTTFYNPSPAFNGNGANIAIPAQTISGTVVAPGAWFSFWKTVGDITVAKGYRLGGAIVDGHTVEGKTIGGGICSTSTTLFNAALRAGFQMGARKNHFYYISRYPVGLDATVFINDGGGAQDMTWRNDTPYPVLIKATTTFGVVRFTLYSVPNGRRVSLSRPIVTNVRPTTTIFEKTSSLPTGRTTQIEFPATGFDAQVTRTVRDASGKIIHRDTFYSHYARVVGVILVGS